MRKFCSSVNASVLNVKQLLSLTMRSADYPSYTVLCEAMLLLNYFSLLLWEGCELNCTIHFKAPSTDQCNPFILWSHLSTLLIAAKMDKSLIHMPLHVMPQGRRTSDSLSLHLSAVTQGIVEQTSGCHITAVVLRSCPASFSLGDHLIVSVCAHADDVGLSPTVCLSVNQVVRLYLYLPFWQKVVLVRQTFSHTFRFLTMTRGLSVSRRCCLIQIIFTCDNKCLKINDKRNKRINI